MDKIECIKVFSRAARLGSFTAAAIELNTTQGAVSKKVAWLEKSIGITLFDRTPRKVVLTDSGKTYLNACEHLLEQITYTEQNLRSEQDNVTGTLKISAPSAFSRQQLAKPISLFLQQNPELQLEVLVTDKLVDLYDEDVDIAIRAAFLKDSGLKARKLLEHHVCYFAAPSYLDRVADVTHPNQLKELSCITYSLARPSNSWWFGKEKFAVNESIRSDDPEFIVEMALLGNGIAAMPRWMVNAYLTSGELVEVFSHFPTHSLPMYAVYKSSEHIPNRVRVLIDYLADYFD